MVRAAPPAAPHRALHAHARRDRSGAAHPLPDLQGRHGASYPELNDTFHEVSESAYGEEDAFRRTLETGTTILDVAVNKAKSDSAEPVVAGEDAFKLHDTYGFPIELTLEMAAEQGVKVDEAKFRELMAEQKSRARADALKKRHNVDLSVYDDFKKTLVSPIDFLATPTCPPAPR